MSSLKRLKVYFIVATLVSFIILSYYYINTLDKTLYFTEGKIDLSKTDFSKDGIINLDGEWEFYWNQLLEPNDFNQSKQGDFNYIYVPGNWLSDEMGNNYSKRGYATYRMMVENIPNFKYFALKKGNIRNSSKIYVNGNLVLQDGVVSKDLEGSVGKNNSEVVYFELEDSSAEIIIQVANHEYIVGGIAKPIRFGIQEKLTKEHIRKITFELAMILIVITIGLFYLGLFLTSKYYRVKEPATLPLSLSCLFLGFMNGIYSERIITILFPEITLNLTYRFGHFMNAMSMIMILLVINKVDKRFISNRVRNILICFYVTFLFCVLTLPLHSYLKTLSFYMNSAIIIHFVLWLWIFILFLRDDFNSSYPTEHIIIIISIFSIFLFWIDLSLFSLGLKPNMLISFLSIAVYSIALATLLIVRYSKSYKKNEELSIKLIETFSTLDQTTKEVEKNEIAFLQAQIKPHFLFNALSSIISLCYTDGNKAASLLTDLSNYLKKSFDIDLKTNYITIGNELKLIQSYVDIEKARFGDRIKMIYDIDESVLDFKISPLFIEPLVENAIKHGVLKNKNGGEIKLTIKTCEKDVYISVEDNGKGIDIEQIKAIKDLDEKKVISHGGNGVSLRNVYIRLRNIYGEELNFDTTNDGTKVFFMIPIMEDYEVTEYV